jgi:hypothetical protein
LNLSFTDITRLAAEKFINLSGSAPRPSFEVYG